jgi:hypothetical protein
MILGLSWEQQTGLFDSKFPVSSAPPVRRLNELTNSSPRKKLSNNIHIGARRCLLCPIKTGPASV